MLHLDGRLTERDVDVASRDHDPECPVYGSMDRTRLVALLREAFRAGDGPRWAMLAEHVADRMDTITLTIKNRAAMPAVRAIVKSSELQEPAEVVRVVRQEVARQARAVEVIHA